MRRNVALVLSSGGPRGFAYIGAIEALLERGYTITSIAGSSIGSLIGGIYAAGKLKDFKEWLYTLKSWKLLSLMDITIGNNHFVKGDKVISTMMDIVPNVNIEDLLIPYCAVATDLYTGEEVVLNEGKLFTAIRASISIPSLFKPYEINSRTLIDGAIANALPLNRVARKDDDILVAFDVNYVDVKNIKQILANESNRHLEKKQIEKEKLMELQKVIEEMKENSDMSLLKKLKNVGSRSLTILQGLMDLHNNGNDDSLDYGKNYFEILERTFNLMNHKNTELSLALYQPDILVRMPFDSYGEINDYAKAQEISDYGYELMNKSLDSYEKTYYTCWLN